MIRELGLLLYNENGLAISEAGVVSWFVVSHGLESGYFFGYFIWFSRICSTKKK